MSRKTTATDYFVPSKGIREDVIEHQLENIFGSRARFRKSSTREGWVVSNGKKVINDPVKQLRSLTELVNATREREAAERQWKERPKQEPSVGNRGAPVLPNSVRASQDPFAQESAQARHQDRPDTSILARTASLASRFPTEQQSFRPEASLSAPNPAPYAQPRIDGHSPRSSSLQVNNTPAIEIPSKTDRHQKDFSYGESYNEVGSFQAGSFSQGPTVPRYGNHGMQDPSIAAKDVKRQYEEKEFRDFLEWQEYKSLRRKVDAEVIPQRRRRQLEDEAPDENATANFSRLSLGPTTTTIASHRHSDNKSRGGTAAPQNSRANPRLEAAKRSRPMQDVEEDSESSSDPKSRESSPDGVIGHLDNPNSERHRDNMPELRQNYTLATRDLGPATRQPSAYATDTRSGAIQKYSLSTTRVSSQSRGDYDDEDSRRPRSQRGDSYYSEEQARRNRHADAEAQYVTPNTGRRRDREYIPDSGRRR